MPRKNEWTVRFGAKRRATDKAYCAAAEAACVSVAPVSPWQAQLDAIQNERRRELALLTGTNFRTT